MSSVSPQHTLPIGKRCFHHHHHRYLLFWSHLPANPSTNRIGACIGGKIVRSILRRIGPILRRIDLTDVCIFLFVVSWFSTWWEPQHLLVRTRDVQNIIANYFHISCNGPIILGKSRTAQYDNNNCYHIARFYFLLLYMWQYSVSYCTHRITTIIVVLLLLLWRQYEILYCHM